MPNMGKQSASRPNDSGSRPGFCIFIDTLCERHTPSVRGEGGLPFVFATRNEAEREIAETAIERLQDFLDGERCFDEATPIEEYVVEVDVLSDGSIVCEKGKVFGSGKTPRRRGAPLR